MPTPRWRPELIAGISLLLAACSSAVDANDPAVTTDRRDLAVWRAFIHGRIPSHQLGYRWAFAVETSRRFQGPGTNLVRDSTEPQAAVFIEDFLRRNRHPARLPVADLASPSEEIIWVAPAELPTGPNDSARWRALAERAPDVRRISVITRPAYDASRTRAFVAQTEICRPDVTDCERRPITMEYRLVDARWQSWRLQTIPPDSGLSNPRLEMRVE
jgi:hypothetical protein